MKSGNKNENRIQSTSNIRSPSTLTVIHQTFFAPLSRPNEIFAHPSHRFVLIVKMTMSTTWHLDGSVFQSSSVNDSVPILDFPLSPKNIASMRYPLKLSILEASVDWKRDGAGRMLAYINLSRCIEAIHPRPPHWEEEELLGILSLSLFVGGRTTTTTKLGSDIIDQAGKDVLAGYRATFDDDLGRPRPIARPSTIFKHPIRSIIIHGWNYAWFWFHDWFLERVGRKDTIYFRPSFVWDVRIAEQGFERKESDVCHGISSDKFFFVRALVFYIII